MKSLSSAFLFIFPFILFPRAGVAQEKIALPIAPRSERTGLLLTDKATIALIHHSSGDLAHDYVTQLSLWDRTQLTDGYRLAAEWVAQKAKGFGLEEVVIEEYPSDGTVEYFGSRTARAWTVKKGELWMTAPFKIKLTSFAELPMSLCRNSATCDVEAELVDIGPGLTDDDYKEGIAGEIVLTSSAPSAVVTRAVREKGALGIVSSWSVPEFDYLNRRPGDFPDQVGWSSLPAQGGDSLKTFAFLVSARRAQELQAIMRAGKKIQLRATVEAESAPGSLDVVSGIIRGTKYPNEEIVVTAHLDHYKPGSNDNASGSASILEMARTMKHLIDAGIFPPPLRTVRFLWVPEYAGTWAWFSKHIHDPVKRIANLNFDMLGEDLSKTNAVFSFSYTPDSNPSYLNAVMESILEFMNKHNDDRYPPQKEFHIISLTGSRNRLQGRMMPFMVGTDYEVFNNLKIPGTQVGGWPDYFYHSSEDSPDKTDPTQLHRVVFSGLAAMTMIGYADDPHAPDFAQLAFVYGRRRIQSSETRAAERILSATVPNLSENEQWGRNIVRHAYRREKAAIGSSKVFARADQTRNSIEQIAAMLEDDEKVSLKNIEDLAAMKARALNVARRSLSLTSAEERASRLIPRRKDDQQLLGLQYVARKLSSDTSADIQSVISGLSNAANALRALGAEELFVWSLVDAPAYYADGKKSILDIRDAVAAEYTLIPVETLELYFRAFERAGVMTIEEK
jgi:hypothetical protein